MAKTLERIEKELISLRQIVAQKQSDAPTIGFSSEKV
jgi:hypothetical protein